MGIWNRQTQSLNRNNTQQYEVFIPADKNGNLKNVEGHAANIPLSEGLLSGYEDIHKFGYVDGTSTSPSTVWTADGLYPWDTVSGVLSVSSNDVGEVTTEVIVEGLDVNHNEISETFTISGTTTDVGTTTFLRVYRARVTGGDTNTGTIDVVRQGVTVGEIGAGFGQSLMGVFTIPAGKTGFMTSLEGSTSKAQASLVSLFARELNGAFLVKSTVSLFQAASSIEYSAPLRFPEKTDVEIRVIGTTNATVSADFDLILVDNTVLV